MDFERKFFFRWESTFDFGNFLPESERQGQNLLNKIKFSYKGGIDNDNIFTNNNLFN